MRQGCVLSPYLFNLYTEFIFRKSDEMQGINIGGKNINNLRYADDTVLMAESEQQLQALVSLVKENSECMGLDMNIKKTKEVLLSKVKHEIKVNIEGEHLEQV